jgi:hypothetical protein
MRFPHLYHAFILWIGDGTGLPDTILHIHAGLIVMMATRIATGRSLGSWVPLGVVIAAEFFNELMDYLVYGLRVADTASDVFNTMLWPVVIFLGVRFRRLRGKR